MRAPDFTQKFCRGLMSCTNRDEDAVSIFELLRFVGHNLSQTLQVAHSDDADVVVEAEGLDEGEVDLQSDVALETLVHGQHAEGHAVRVAVKALNKKHISTDLLMFYRDEELKEAQSDTS